MLEIGKDTIPGKTVLNPREWIYTAYNTDLDNGLCPSVWLLVPNRELAVPEPDIRIEVRERTIQLISRTYCHGAHFKDRGRAVFSDNYFDLLPGVPKSIKYLLPNIPNRLKVHTVR